MRSSLGLRRVLSTGTRRGEATGATGAALFDIVNKLSAAGVFRGRLNVAAVRARKGHCGPASLVSKLGAAKAAEPQAARLLLEGTAVTPFRTIRSRAAKRKGGEAALAALLPKVSSPKALAKLQDDRVLAEMTKRIFSAGFAWSVIESKWPGFEQAFHGFAPKPLLAKPDEFWEGLAGDKRIVRNPQKIMAVRANAQFIADIAKEHGSFGKFLAEWPVGDQVGLLELLGKRGARLGGRTSQYFLRSIGKDGFVTSSDVVACLRGAGLDIAESPTSKKDLRKIQDQFNAWAKETGLPYAHLSRICAMSIGENYSAEALHSRASMEE